MRKLACTLLMVPSLSLMTLCSEAQQNPSADRLFAARALYYTPTASGLESFHCTASMDWKDALTRFSGKVIPADNPLLVYLSTVHLSVTDNLRGAGDLEWVDATAAPDAMKANIDAMHSGLEQMFSGFFQSWNPYMNGTMVPAPDATTIVTQVGDEIKLHAESNTFALDELLDKNLLLTQVHVVTPGTDVFAYPTYADTPDGRLVSSVRSTVRQPPSAPPLEVTMSATYAKVQSFRLPATVSFEVKNVGTFVLNLSACTVQTSSKSAIKP